MQYPADEHFLRDDYVASKRNRYFYSDSFEDLLITLVEEVSHRFTPEFKIRQEYAEAFAAINKFGLDGEAFLNVLSLGEAFDRYELCNLVNPMRKVIENLISKLVNAYVIPDGYDLNKIPYLLAGQKKKDSNSKYREDYLAYKSQDYMSPSLFESFKFFINYVQDGSHDRAKLIVSNEKKSSYHFTEYLRDTGDTYIVKSLAVIGLDIIRWLSQFYDKYIEYQLFKFVPFEGKVVGLKPSLKGAIVKAENSDEIYFILDPDVKEGTIVKILSRDTTSRDYGDYYAGKYEIVKS